MSVGLSWPLLDQWVLSLGYGIKKTFDLCCCFLEMLGCKPRFLLMLDRCSTTKLHPQTSILNLKPREKQASFTWRGEAVGENIHVLYHTDWEAEGMSVWEWSGVNSETSRHRAWRDRSEGVLGLDCTCFPLAPVVFNFSLYSVTCWCLSHTCKGLTLLLMKHLVWVMWSVEDPPPPGMDCPSEGWAAAWRMAAV